MDSWVEEGVVMVAIKKVVKIIFFRRGVRIERKKKVSDMSPLVSPLHPFLLYCIVFLVI